MIFKIFKKVRKFYLIGLMMLAVTAFCMKGYAADEEEEDDFGFDMSSLPSWVIDAALKFVNNPDDVFDNFHLDNVDYTPVLEGARGSIRTNFLMSVFPFSWANVNVKINAVSDEKYYYWMPQIDIVGNYGRIVALDMADAYMTDDSTDSFKAPTMSDYSVGLLLTKAVSRETRMYMGLQYSVVAINFEFPEPVEITDDTSLSEINVSRKDYILVTGICNVLSDEKRVVAYMGYGFKYKKLFSRFAWHYDHLELGFNIYPEGLLVIHPFMGWHWNF
ncbi:hypothetical protein ACFLTD_02570 [Elusimicrobiota bacterium]